MRTSDIGPLIVLIILFVLVAAALNLLIRFWGECQADTARARERVTWPTTTVEATLTDVSYRRRRVDRPLRAVGEYTYTFGGQSHTTEQYEEVWGSDEEVRAAGDRLLADGKVIQLDVQYDPNDSSVVSDEIVTYVPTCRWWVGSFFVIAAFCMALILRGIYRTVTH